MDYVVLREDRKPFKFTYKLKRLLEYMTEVKGNLILFLDAFDVIIRDDPNKIIDVYHSKNCKLLFASTMFKGGWVCMPKVYEWYLKYATPKRGHYLNSGVFIGEWDFTLKVIKESVKYIVPWSLTNEEYLATGRGDRQNRKLCEKLPNYPVGAPDQDIFRDLAVTRGVASVLPPRWTVVALGQSQLSVDDM